MQTLVCKSSSRLYKLDLIKNLASAAEASWQQSFENVGKVIKVTGGISHSVCLSKEGKIFVRGSNYFGQAGFFPQLSGGVGILDSGDDSIEESLELQEGVKDQNFKDIAAGDYHNLALTQSGQVYCWGAGLLGNGSNLFSSEPVLLGLLKEPAKHIAASQSRSGVVTRDSESVYIWGFERDEKETLVGRNLSPFKVVLDQPLVKNVSRFLLTDKLFALASNKRIAVFGSLATSSIAPTFPYNPAYAEVADKYPISHQLCFEMGVENILDIQLSGNYLYTLKADGSVYLVDLLSGVKRELKVPEPIKQMAVGRLTASFLARGSGAIYSFAGTFSKPKDIPFLSFFFNWKTFKTVSSSNHQLIPGIPLHEAVVTQMPIVCPPLLKDFKEVENLFSSEISLFATFK